MGNLFSIGYAKKSLDEFVALLKENKVDCLVDVRTSPYSKQFPQYNEGELKLFLKKHNIIYLSFKKEFGARRSEDSVFSNIIYPSDGNKEVVIFSKVWETNEFQKGVERIKKGLEKNYNICFMCSESNPHECHRHGMISEYFYRYENIEVLHIFDFGQIYNHLFYDRSIEKNFYEQKKLFLKKNEEELNYCGNLFLKKNTMSEHLNQWLRFFSEYTREKGLYLQNLLIGYKKEMGDDYE